MKKIIIIWATLLVVLFSIPVASHLYEQHKQQEQQREYAESVAKLQAEINSVNKISLEIGLMANCWQEQADMKELGYSKLEIKLQLEREGRNLLCQPLLPDANGN